MADIVVFHGSEEVVSPVFGKGKTYNDYGLGFYCTENLELAKEWACSHGTDGFANQYSLEMNGLSVLNLNSEKYNILNWLAILLENRKFAISQGLPFRAKEYIIENFLPKYKSYDIIRGYRADDSYFAYATAFVNGTLSVEELKKAMMLGELGEQIVLKSELAFSNIKLVDSISANKVTYFHKYINRDKQAREKYQAMTNKMPSENGLYVIDIIREKIKNDDSRL